MNRNALHFMKEALEYFLFRTLQRLAGRLSFRNVGRLGRRLGLMVFSLTNFRKRITLDNLAKAFPEKTADERRAIARGAYCNYGIAILEMLWMGQAAENELTGPVRLMNPEIVHQALARGKGLILLSGHFGSWEMILTGIRLRLGMPMVVIVQHQRNQRIDDLVDSQRRRFGNTTVPMGLSVREVLRALQRKSVLALLGDQSGSRESIFIDFFGRPAATHKGPAAFSLKSGAPIVMLFILREPDGQYRVEFEEVDRTGLDAYTNENIVELTRRHASLLEKYVRQYPDHWLWMHKRWKHTQHYESLQHTAPGQVAG